MQDWISEEEAAAPDAFSEPLFERNRLSDIMFIFIYMFMIIYVSFWKPILPRCKKLLPCGSLDL